MGGAITSYNGCRSRSVASFLHNSDARRWQRGASAAICTTRTVGQVPDFTLRLCKICATKRHAWPFTYLTDPGAGTHFMPRLLRFPSRQSASKRFEVLMQPHFDDLYAAARRLAMQDSDAKDLVQEVCLKAYANLDELAQMAYPRAWLLRVLYHQFVDDQRNRKRSPIDDAGSIEPGETEPAAEHVEARPDEQADLMLRVDRVLRAMELLDKELCALLAMHDVEGMTIRELCAATGLTESAVKSRLFRTRAKLGRLLKNEQFNRPNLRVVGGDK